MTFLYFIEISSYYLHIIYFILSIQRKFHETGKEKIHLVRAFLSWRSFNSCFINCQNGQRCLRVYLLGSALKSSAFIEKTRTRQWILTLTSDPPIETLAEECEWQWRSWFSFCLFSGGSGHGLMPYLNCTCGTGFYFPVSATTVNYLLFTGLLYRSSPSQRMPPPHVLWKLQKHPNIVHSVPH